MFESIQKLLADAAHEMYTVLYGCTNCRRDCCKSFRAGQQAPDRTKCTKCGCFTAIKKW